MTILDDAADYHRTKQIENDAKNAAKPLGDEIKKHLAGGGSDYTVRRVDKNSGEVSQAIDLPDYNVRYFLRSRAGSWKQFTRKYETKCPNCGAEVKGEVAGEIQTQSPSVALDSEPIADMAAAAREAQRRPVEAEG